MRPIAVVLAAAALIGAVAAAAGIALLDLAAAADWYGQGGAWLLIAPAAGGVLCALIARHLPGGVFLGLADMILQAQRGGSHHWRHHLLSTTAAVASLLSGASVGQYGPVAHLGGALAGAVHRFLTPRIAIACGIAAAVAAAFNAPITALVFVHEVVLRHYSLRAFTPVAVSSVVGYSVSVGVFNRPLFLEFSQMAPLQPSLVLLFICMGVVFGFLAAAYLRGIFWVAARTRQVPLLMRLPAAGLAAGALMFFLPDIAGGGKGLLLQAVGGLPAAEASALFLAKIAATILCLGVGFAGGVVSPTLAVGALAGLLFFHAADALLPALALPNAAVMALCGMMALTAPVLGAPLAAILFTMELSGSYAVAIESAVAIAIAMQIAAKTGCRSFYDMQLGRRGIALHLRRDEWQLQTESIVPLLRPVTATIPPDADLRTAIQTATAQQCGELHLADADGRYCGSLPLPAALQRQRDGSTETLRALAAQTPAPVLKSSDTLLTAMKKLEDFVGTTVAVVDDGGMLMGVVSEGDLLRRYHQLIRDYRSEETAVT